jgi:hypothetical protein
MTAPLKNVRRPGLAMSLSLAASVTLGTVSRAQNLDVPLAIVPAQPVYMLSEANFNGIVYGNLPPAMVRDRFERMLAQKIAAIERTCHLSPAQKETLELAGKGEIKRRLDRIEDHKNVVNRRYDQDEYVRVVQELQTLNRSLSAEPFGDGSLFAKALKTSLAEDQAARLGDVESDRDLERYSTRVEAYVSLLAHSLGLSSDQRRRLRNLVLEETPPPRKFGAYDLLIIQYQLSRIPEERLRPIFDDTQWRTLSRRFDESKDSEQVLRSGGYLRDGAAAGPAAQPERVGGAGQVQRRMSLPR